MDVGTVFQEDGLYKLLVKLGDDGWPQVRPFPSFAEMLESLQTVGLPLGELVEFCSRGLKSKGKLAQLPGRIQDWATYLAQG